VGPSAGRRPGFFDSRLTIYDSRSLTNRAAVL
jgi:hypothetical protein